MESNKNWRRRDDGAHWARENGAKKLTFLFDDDKDENEKMSFCIEWGWEWKKMWTYFMKIDLNSHFPLPSDIFTSRFDVRKNFSFQFGMKMDRIWGYTNTYNGRKYVCIFNLSFSDYQQIRFSFVVKIEERRGLTLNFGDFNKNCFGLQLTCKRIN